jgi:hypothetical protein
MIETNIQEINVSKNQDKYENNLNTKHENLIL